jgi:hypothetical protein
MLIVSAIKLEVNALLNTSGKKHRKKAGRTKIL